MQSEKKSNGVVKIQSCCHRFKAARIMKFLPNAQKTTVHLLYCLSF
ncbi:hypothetical protein GMES_3170 [Paraglaciecola mesophila KMM 241]|uniref:Uncharacterized protein n=1 Tax=Paraglaciecola mesophila KMM 241 TaxID=1128912 RepID=K6ZQ45_9ALTE|nr:hypothetical protein GMES_3170 [Paraglaciecola mesophila KMM 241]